jgi:hypothetical protein
MSDVNDFDWLSAHAPAPTDPAASNAAPRDIRACSMAYAGAWEDIPKEDKPDNENPADKALQDTSETQAIHRLCYS